MDALVRERAAQEAENDRPFELGLMFSRRCNIECRHCGIESGPRNRSRMTLDFARDVIQQAAALPTKVRTISFTGGEPFIYPKELEELLDLANGSGLSTRVVTNGFWGRRRATGTELLHRMRLAGLDTINFSADRYHLEFLEAAFLRQAIDIAFEVGFVPIVNMTINAEGDPVEVFCSMYGIERGRVASFNEESYRQAVRAGTDLSHLDGKILLTTGRLIAMGRSAQFPEEHFLSPLSSFPHGGCLEVVNRPVVYPDGDLMACCCAGGKVAGFRVGSLYDAPLAELVGQMRTRSHFRFINQFGPRMLFEAMSQMQGRPRGDHHASICDVCVSATKDIDPEKVDSLLEHWLVERLVSQR